MLDFKEEAFYHLQDDFLTAVVEGDRAMADFATRITDLLQQTDFDSTESYRQDLVHNVAFSVSTLASSFIDLESEAEKMSTSMVSEIEDIFSCLSLGDQSCAQPLKSTGTQKNSELFEWLLSNIHNPYPSSMTKRKIASSSNIPMTYINEWFSQTRRRIGWTSLSKRHFKGDRQLTIDCASHIFAEGTDHKTYPAHIVRDFMNLRKAAEELYMKSTMQTHQLQNLNTGMQILLGRNSLEDHEPRRVSGKKRRRSSSGRLEEATYNRKRNKTADNSINSMASKSVREHMHSVERGYLTSPKYETPSRSPSMSISESSRASTTAPSTPSVPMSYLPSISLENSIDDWLFNIPLQPYPTIDSTHSPSIGVKQARIATSLCFPPEEPICPSSSSFISGTHSSTTQLVDDDIFDILSHLDFTVPPPVSVDDKFLEGGLLHVNGLEGFDNGRMSMVLNGAERRFSEVHRTAKKRRMSDAQMNSPTKRLRMVETSSRSLLNTPLVVDDSHVPVLNLNSDLGVVPGAFDVAPRTGDYPQLNDIWENCNSSEPFPKLQSGNVQSANLPLVALDMQPSYANQSTMEACASDEAQQPRVSQPSSTPFSIPATVEPKTTMSSYHGSDKQMGMSVHSSLARDSIGLHESERRAKLKRLNHLLVEATMLQLEVFG